MSLNSSRLINSKLWFFFSEKCNDIIISPLSLINFKNDRSWNLDSEEVNWITTNVVMTATNTIQSSNNNDLDLILEVSKDYIRLHIQPWLIILYRHYTFSLQNDNYSVPNSLNNHVKLLWRFKDFILLI